MSEQEPYYRLSEVVGPAISLLQPYALVGPLTIAIVGGVAAASVSPNVSSAEALESLNASFATTAQVIAALLIALAVEARYVQIRPVTAGLTLTYVSLGLVAAVIGTTASLPHGVYPVLVGTSAGGGIGALASVVVVGFEALRSAAHEARNLRIDAISHPTRVAPPPPPDGGTGGSGQET